LPNELPLYYATRDGQARRIATRIQARLMEQAVSARPVDLAGERLVSSDLSQLPLAVLVAAVRYGRHLPEAIRFLELYSALPVRAPLVLVSVNLTARKPGKDTAEGNPYLRKLIARHRLEPAVALAIGGRLDYALYTWWDREIIRLIMRLTGGPTDPRTAIDYASPEAIDQVAARIAELYRAADSARSPDGAERNPGIPRERLG
jgi:menaquinone-dependent protoporphyrinogen oxidase